MPIHYRKNTVHDCYKWGYPWKWTFRKIYCLSITRKYDKLLMQLIFQGLERIRKFAIEEPDTPTRLHDFIHDHPLIWAHWLHRVLCPQICRMLITFHFANTALNYQISLQNHITQEKDPLGHTAHRDHTESISQPPEVGRVDLTVTFELSPSNADRSDGKARYAYFSLISRCSR